MRFRNAIVRRPGRSIVDGITSTEMGKPDFEKACKQHSEYVETLRNCGMEVFILDALEDFPDSTFIEDVALLTRHCAIITNPGADSRRGETGGMHDVLSSFFNTIYTIEEPGKVEAGDIMMVGEHFYIGISDRTNLEGAGQIIGLLEKQGMAGSIVRLEEVLHLKTGVSYLENKKLLACGEFVSKDEFSGFKILEVREEDAYSANCIWVNGTVLVPSGYPKTSKLIAENGYEIKELEMSEFRKLDGGLSCLSLRF